MRRIAIASATLGLAGLGLATPALAAAPDVVPMAPADHIVLNHDGDHQGEAWYFQSTDEIRILDNKDGDHMYAKYGFTNCDNSNGCGTGGNADAPGTEYTARNNEGHVGFQQDHPINPRSTYIVIKLCQDDFPPDTCTNWKRAFN